MQKILTRFFRVISSKTGAVSTHKMFNAKNYEFRLKRMEKKMIIKRRAMGYLLIPFCYLLLSACGGGSSTPADERLFTISATLTGLEGDSVEVGMNGSELIKLTGNESFSFLSGLKIGDAYSVTVSTQPSNPGQFCTVTNGSGTIKTDVAFTGTDNVEISCVTLIALTSVNGTWLGECQVDGVTSTRAEQVLRDGVLKLTVRTFDETLCNTPHTSEPFVTGTYTLGSAVSVDGSVDGITTATQVNSVFDNTLPADFDLVAIKGDKLYLGLNGADGSATDGSSAAKRPTQLDATKVFTKQP